MKKILLIGILGYLCLVVPVQAQLQKGTKYLGTTFSFSGTNFKSGSTDATRSSLFLFNPSIQLGKMIKDNVMIGIGAGTSLNVSHFKQEISGVETKGGSHLNTYSLSPFVRHYKSINSKLAVFLNSSADLSYIHYKTYGVYNTGKDDGYSVGLKVVPGIAYWISPRFSLESDLNLISLGVSYQDFMDTKSVNFNSAITSTIPQYFSVRASWYFQKN